jgi:hypothetical protein
MSEGTAVFGNVETKLTLNDFDLWAEGPKDDGWDFSFLRLDSYAMLSQIEYDDGSDLDIILPMGSQGILYSEGYVRNDASRCLPEAYQIARAFKKREWGIVLLTFDGPDSPFEKKVDIGPDVKPFLENDMKEAFTETVIVYLGPQLEKGQHADYGPILVPLRYPYMVPDNWEPEYWTL